MADSPGTTSRFNVIPVKQAGIRFKEGAPEEYAATIHPPDQHEDDRVSMYSQDIDDIGYITCERYDRPRRGVDYDSDDGEGYGGEDTFEAMPRETNYVLSLTREGRARPTILELREDNTGIARVESGISRKDSAAVLIAPVNPTVQGIKFGWIRGVFVRCLLNIWGVLLFMRLSWVVAQAGLGLTVAILALAAVVVVITTLSMSAISTNGAVKETSGEFISRSVFNRSEFTRPPARFIVVIGGGTYFLISRSLGPEFGGAVGIVFSLANAVAVGMNCVGFAEALVELLAEHGVMMVDFTNDVRIVGIITLVGLLALILSPNALKWEGRTQLVLFGVIIASFINFFVGTFLPRSEQKLSKGIVEYSATTFSDNFWPNFRDGHSFMTMFGIFFPACTGIMAGANISGDLKNPGTAIPKGTLLAIFVSIMSYLLCALAIAATGIRDATGSVLDLINGNITDCPVVCTGNGTENCLLGCRWGISNSYQMMTEMSAVGPIITTGVFAASLSSALACLVSAPKIFQALCRDNLFPYIGIFGKGYGKTDEPRLAYLLAFLIGCAIVAIADLNAIALIISNFYIGTYVLINYACFDASLSASPGFRPAFRYYNQWVSLLGALLCVTCMFMINWLGALLTMALIVFLYLYMHFKAPDVNWGSSIQARAFKSTVQQALKLMTVEDHVKNFRPQVLVLSGLPSSRPALVYFVNTFTKNHGMMICGQVLPGEENLHVVHKLHKPVYAWFLLKKLKCFHSAVAAPDFRQGVRALLQTVGIGKMKPNMVIFGFSRGWMKRTSVINVEYCESISDSFDMNMGVGIFRLQEGMYVEALEDVTGSTFNLTSLSQNDAAESNADDFQTGDSPQAESQGLIPGMGRRESLPPMTKGRTFGVSLVPEDALKKNSSACLTEPALQRRVRSFQNVREAIDEDSEEFRKSQYISRMELADRFHKNTKDQIVGEIHVWWLYDDGGLTLLIPHLISKKPPWDGCKLKIFYLQGKPHLLDEAQRKMIALLSKFRIDFSDAVAVNTTKPPKEDSVIWFNQLIQPFRANAPDASSEVGQSSPGERGDGSASEATDDNVNRPQPITKDDLTENFVRTQRHIRMRELLKEHSSDASLIVMTLPVPKKNGNPTLYLAWLETLTSGMPPILLLRGNQQSVMTFYS